MPQASAPCEAPGRSERHPRFPPCCTSRAKEHCYRRRSEGTQRRKVRSTRCAPCVRAVPCAGSQRAEAAVASLPDRAPAAWPSSHAVAGPGRTGAPAYGMFTPARCCALSAGIKVPGAIGANNLYGVAKGMYRFWITTLGTTNEWSQRKGGRKRHIALKRRACRARPCADCSKRAQLMSKAMTN